MYDLCIVDLTTAFHRYGLCSVRKWNDYSYLFSCSL